MIREYYRVIYTQKGSKFKVPFMHISYNDEELEDYIRFAKTTDKENIKIYKILETSELIKEID